MAFITLGNDYPGISGLLAFRSQTAEPLRRLAQTLLRGASPLTTAERELIAAYVSRLNECSFCWQGHAAAARHLYGTDRTVVDAVLADPDNAPISGKLRALLHIAAKVQRKAATVSQEDIDEARANGADDVEIHDAVLVAAAFCMYNRYVDGLGTWAPDSPDLYDEMGAGLAATGYVREEAGE